MRIIQMLDSLSTPKDPSGETVGLEQMVPEYLLCGILKKEGLQQSIIGRVILSFSSEQHLKL